MEKKLNLLIFTFICCISAWSVTIPQSVLGYLQIITSLDLKEAADEYAQWKRTMGYRVDVVCLNTTNEYDVTRAISNDADYLLILGDFTKIPAKDSRRYLNTGAYNGKYGFESSYYQHNTDYDFSRVGHDPIHRIKIGRIAVRDIFTARTVLNKIRNYEENLPAAPNSDFYKSALHITYYEDALSDQGSRDDIPGYEDYRFLLTTEEIIDHLSPHFNQVEKIYNRDYHCGGQLHWNNTLYSIGDTIPSNMIFGGDATNLTNAINNGVLYAMYYNHGGGSTWNNPDFRTRDFDSLNNGSQLPVVFCCCCYNFRELASYSFAELMLEKENGGAVALVASSDMILTGLMDTFIERCFNAIWPSENFYPVFGEELQPQVNTDSLICRPAVYRLGDIVQRGLIDMESHFAETILDREGSQGNSLRTPSDFPDFIRYMKETINIVGDPTMEMYTSTPHYVAQPDIILTEDSVKIRLHDGDAVIALSVPESDSNDVRSIYGSQASYAIEDEEYTLSIHRHNSNVYTTTICNQTINIQNETISNHLEISADKVTMGNHVTDDMPHGDVILLDGSHTRLCGNKVVLSSGTFVRKGASLTINKTNPHI